MKKIILGAITLLFVCTGCEQLNNQKKDKVSTQVSELACQDARDFIVKYGSSLLPIVGNIILDKVIDKDGKGKLCDCVSPVVKSSLKEKFTVEELEAMITEKKERQKTVKNILVENRKELLDCYTESGMKKGRKLIDKVLDKLEKKVEE